jgi:hypothetical protein
MPFPAVIHQQVPTLPPIWTQSENFARNGICVNQRWHWTQAQARAYDMLTCVRPTHKIWLCGENRFASPQEALRSHGVFATDFKDPLTVLNLDATLALDLAGNAFSTSCLIAKILCTMVNATPWKQLAKSMPVTRPGILEECARSAGRNSMSSGSKEGSGSSGPPEEQPDSEPPKKR